ncbi:hypothetical protein G8767_10380 [Rhodococcus sp. IC4_135]|uniref:hypothetical protein n=1 Tax=Rhodococcus sp. IC4_135 TaxID=2715537 RepID=UPI001421D6D5|nr:hypothetical protein [Rhodococcus sp. IC4_135]
MARLGVAFDDKLRVFDELRQMRRAACRIEGLVPECNEEADTDVVALVGGGLFQVGRLVFHGDSGVVDLHLDVDRESVEFESQINAPSPDMGDLILGMGSEVADQVIIEIFMDCSFVR